MLKSCTYVFTTDPKKYPEIHAQTCPARESMSYLTNIDDDSYLSLRKDGFLCCRYSNPDKPSLRLPMTTMLNADQTRPSNMHSDLRLEPIQLMKQSQASTSLFKGSSQFADLVREILQTNQMLVNLTCEGVHPDTERE